MNKHSIVKTTLGVGLMAASLAASAAAIHSFTTPMMYYKLNGAAVTYVAFVPSGPYSGFQGASGVIMLDLYNSGTVSTWNYAMGGAATVAAANAGAGWTDGAAISFSAPGYPVTSAATVEFAMAAANALSLGDTQSISLSFIQTPVISSQACNVTFHASINSDDYLQFTNFTIRPSGWVTDASANYTVHYRSKSGTATSDITTFANKAGWEGSNFSVTRDIKTFGAYTLAMGGATSDYSAAASTLTSVAASQVTKGNLCTAVYTAKNALNSSGSTIGGKAGLMRLW